MTPKMKEGGIVALTAPEVPVYRGILEISALDMRARPWDWVARVLDMQYQDRLRAFRRSHQELHTEQEEQ